MKPYVLTDEAEADLRDIIRYTRKEWGAEHVRTYIAKLDQGVARLATGAGNFRDMSDIYPELRMARCEHHFVFCLPRQNEPALIIAILHERMDIMVRLAKRLDIES